MIMIALVDGQPKQLTLYEILHEYLKHPKNVVTRRTKFDLDKAEKRAHLLEGFRIALENIDSVFEPYFTTKHTKRGTGIGLYMTKMIIENNMHGFVKVLNTTNGALFTIKVE